MTWRAFGMGGVVWMLGAGLWAAEVIPPPTAKVRLAVLVVFDQLRGDYLERWQSLFGEGGFRRLQTDGAWFTRCHYPYASTVTGAGHASLVTGASPDRHGIIANDWYDRGAQAMVYCATSPRYESVPPVPPTSKKRPPGAGSPERLLVPTVGDLLKEATKGKGKVVSLSLKDRGAVLPGGRRPDACYWFEPSVGLFVTSTYYRDRPHPWVAALNQGRLVDRWFGKNWIRFRADLDYQRYSGPDEIEGEGKGVAQGMTFPHPMTGGAAAPGKEYYSALYNSPFGNDLLLELVRRGLEEEQLGRDEVPDLLCISFSCNDPIGHTWGPDSQEVLDVTLRSDRIVRELLHLLDAQVGPGRYVLVLTSDHGICPLPEVSRAAGRDAGRISASLLELEAEEALREKLGRPEGTAQWIEETWSPWVWLNRAVMAQQQRKPAEVEAALAEWLARQPGIQAALTRTQLLGSSPPADALAARVRKSFHPDRAGDVVVVPKPYYLLGNQFATGTTHGTPHPYDTHVPLLVYGPGVRGGGRDEAVTPQATAAILARALGVAAPPQAEVGLPASLGW
ncbi:MAG: alkaline phosphatase family protein [Gemmataceae bacterium]|nr:alkaline phosphatase family protein [Gemmataceae bacterium]MDW8264929.1 alkaline phosphatase family protein [Gemmataceae bacterium]